MSDDEAWKQKISKMVNRHLSPVADEPLPDAQQVVKAHEEHQLANLAQHLEQCGAPARAIATMVAGLKTCPALDSIKDWLLTKEGSLLLAGAAGTWKTTPATAILKRAKRPSYLMGPDGPVSTWVWDARDGLFVHAVALREAAYSSDGRALLERAKRVPWLVMDDLGTEPLDNAGIWQGALDHLIDARYASAGALRTIITTNLFPEAKLRPAGNKEPTFQDRYGARIWRRLTEPSVGRYFYCGAVPRALPGGAP